jgi:putative ABC transport system permease protein
MAVLPSDDQPTDQSTGLPPFRPGFTLRVAGGDVANAGYVIPEGRMFVTPGDAVAATGLFEELGLRVGDTLEVEINGALTTLTIVGRYLDDDDDGSIAMTSVETVRAAVPSIEPDNYLITTSSGADDLAVESALLQSSGYDLDIWTRVDEAEGDEEAQTLKTVMFGLSGVLLAIGTINLVATTMLGVRERMRDYGIYRAIGLTPGQVVLTVASNVGLLALIAAVVGIPLGLLTFRVMFEVVGSDLFGAAPEWYRNPPVWQMALILPGAVAIAAIASALPARQVARLQVARVLRWD